MMAMVKKDTDGHGCHLSHQKFLADLYHGKFMDILFGLKTPYMMDEQAKALSRSGSGNTESETTSAKKRKRKANAANEIPQSNLVKRMLLTIDQLKFTHQKVRFYLFPFFLSGISCYWNPRQNLKKACFTFS